MKTSIVQNKFKVAAALVACLTFIQSAAFAGGSSGNGNGDSAFALQEMAKANPGLSAAEILIKYFKLSEGRVPKLSYRRSAKVDGYNVFYGELFSKEEAGGVEYDLINGEPTKPISLTAPSFENWVQPLGPLLGSENKFIKLIPKNIDLWAAPSGFESKTGLVLKWLSARDYRPTDQTFVELRSYDENGKIVIFTTRPFVQTDGKKLCGTLRDMTSIKMDIKVEEYCSVGYFWID